MPSVQVSMPCYSGVHAGTVTDLVDLLTFTAQKGPKVQNDYRAHSGSFKVWLSIVRNSALSKSRWQLVETARATKATHIFWIDSDMRFHPDLLLLLLKHEKPIVGCNYRMRQGDHEPIVERNGERLVSSIECEEIQDVDTLGFGILLTETSVFDRIKKPFDIEITETDQPDESMVFSARAREAGLRLYVDHWLSLAVGHVGEETYSFEA